MINKKRHYSVMELIYKDGGEQLLDPDFEAVSG